MGPFAVVETERGLGDNSGTRYAILAPGDRLIGKLGRCCPGFSAEGLQGEKKEEAPATGGAPGLRVPFAGEPVRGRETHHQAVSTRVDVGLFEQLGFLGDEDFYAT